AADIAARPTDPARDVLLGGYGSQPTCGGLRRRARHDWQVAIPRPQGIARDHADQELSRWGRVHRPGGMRCLGALVRRESKGVTRRAALGLLEIEGAQCGRIQQRCCHPGDCAKSRDAGMSGARFVTAEYSTGSESLLTKNATHAGVYP